MTTSVWGRNEKATRTGTKWCCGIVTVGGGYRGSAAQRVNQTVDMPNTEHNNWGVSNWTHPIFLQGGNGFWTVVSNRGAPLWGKRISKTWESFLQSFCHALQLSRAGTGNNNMSSNCYLRDYCSFQGLQILQHKKLTPVNVKAKLQAFS